MFIMGCPGCKINMAAVSVKRSMYNPVHYLYILFLKLKQKPKQ